MDIIDEIGIQLPKEDSLALDKIKESIKTSLSKHIKIPSIAAVDGPIISSKNENELELEKKKNMPMMIDLEL